jgi:hypothetical protein
VTYADLTARAPSNASETVAQDCVARMQNTASPMPPAPATPATSADIATLMNWISQGTPMGSCGADPFAGGSTCTSGQYSSAREGNSMAPGQACVACHSRSREAPLFAIAGTVYPSGHEPDNCMGSAGAQVVITDASGAVFTLNTNSAGNFSYSGRNGPVALPYRAKVVLNGRERAMSATQQSGDCNSCHSQSGSSGAPGRIALP